MPNVIFKPRPMVDPYAGRAGELISELFSTIGQIHLLRQQRNQTNAILDIMKNPNLTEGQRQMAIVDVARNGGDVLRNMVARQYVADALVPEYEKKLREQKLESEKARTAYWQAGAGRRTSMGGVDLLDLKRLRDLYQEGYDNAEPDSEEEKQFEAALRKLDQQTLQLTQSQKGTPVDINKISEQWIAPESIGIKQSEAVSGISEPAIKPQEQKLDFVKDFEKLQKKRQEQKSKINRAFKKFFTTKEQPHTQFSFGAGGARYKPPAKSKTDMLIENEMASMAPKETTPKRLPGETIEEYLARVR